MSILKWTTEEDGYSVGDRLLDGVMFAVDVELDLDKVKEAGTFYKDDLYKITGVRPKTPGDQSYLERLGGQGAVDHWSSKVMSHAKRSQAELMTDEIFNLPEVKELWDKYNE
jgi:hypothetical protein